MCVLSENGLWCVYVYVCVFVTVCVCVCMYATCWIDVALFYDYKFLQKYELATFQFFYSLCMIPY